MLGADAEEEAGEGCLPAQGCAVEFAGEAAGEGGAVVALGLKDAVVGCDDLLAPEDAVLKLSHALAEGDGPVDEAAVVGEQRGAAG